MFVQVRNANLLTGSSERFLKSLFPKILWNFKELAPLIVLAQACLGIMLVISSHELASVLLSRITPNRKILLTICPITKQEIAV